MSVPLTDFTIGALSPGLSFFIFMLFNMHMICFSYVCSYLFSSPKSCIAFMPMFIIFLIFLPVIMVNLIVLVFDVGLGLFTLAFGDAAGIIVWYNIYIYIYIYWNEFQLLDIIALYNHNYNYTCTYNHILRGLAIFSPHGSLFSGK